MKMRLNWEYQQCRTTTMISIVLLIQKLSGIGANLNLNQEPLQISTHDIFIKVGENYTAFIAPTTIFNVTFQNETESTLVFHYTVPGIVANLKNLTLVTSDKPVFKNSSVVISSVSAGRVTITGVLEPSISNITVDNIFVRVSTYKIWVLLLISDIVGWLYFVAWSISFYPQIYQNWRRKSVRGLSLDFVFINITGFGVYLIYNIGLYWVTSVQDEYLERYPTGEIPVELNDVVFTMHAVFACGIVVTQCIIYDKGSQTVSNVSRTILLGIYTFLFIMAIVALSAAISWLSFLEYCSYIKLFVTLIKYIPQAYLNWSRKSTSGWCVGNVLLDFTGGLFSVIQMCIIGYNHNDWISIFGDFAKFGLGLFSICFDIFFLVQHYYLYRNHDAYESIEGTTHENDHLGGHHEDMVTSNHIPPQDDEEQYQNDSPPEPFSL